MHKCEPYIRPVRGCENHTHVCASNCTRTGKLKFPWLQPKCQSHQGSAIVRAKGVRSLKAYCFENLLGDRSSFIHLWGPQEQLSQRRTTALQPGTSSFLQAQGHRPGSLTKCISMRLTFKFESKPFNFSMATCRSEPQQRTGVFSKPWSINSPKPFEFRKSLPRDDFQQLCR